MNLLKQTSDKPLYEDLIWSKPENKLHAGKLLIIGGNSFGFASVAEAYAVALNAGIGEVKVLLPDAIQKVTKGVFEHAVFAPSTRSGSLSNGAVETALEAAKWADGVLIVGDVSRNAETASFLELFSEQYKGKLTITRDAVELLIKYSPKIILNRPETNLFLTMSDLQKLTNSLNFEYPFTFDLSQKLFAERLLQLSNKLKAAICVKRNAFIFTSHKNRIAVTEVADKNKKWRIQAATSAAVWHIQNTERQFESLVSSIIS